MSVGVNSITATLPLRFACGFSCALGVDFLLDFGSLLQVVLP